MKKLTTIGISGFLIMGIIVFESCNKGKDDVNGLTEFVADNASFAGFTNWKLEATNQGPDPALSEAHGGNDNTVTRRIYIKDGQSPVNGRYPVGTIVVKQSTNPNSSVNEITAMVKRGNGFNPANNDWEWFMLAPDGRIISDANNQPLRGARLFNGMCGNCHNQASSKDFVFSK